MRLNLIIFGAVFALLMGCKRDKQIIARNAIIGKWKVDKVVYNGETTYDVGHFKFTNKQFVLDDNSFATDLSEIKEVVFTKKDGEEDVFGYYLYEGNTDLGCIFYRKSGIGNMIFIELMTKDILIYSDGGIPSAKYYLSK